MLNGKRFLAGLVALSLVSAAGAQLVTPVPPAPAPSPEYKPPEPVAPPPPATGEATDKPAAAAPAQAAPEPDLPPIDLVKRDGSGKLIQLTMSADQAALEAMLPDLKDDAARTAARKLLDERKAASENVVARNAAVALESREKLRKLETMTDTRELSGINSDMRVLFLNPPLFDQAAQLKILTPKEINRGKAAAKTYRDAVNKDAKDSVGGDQIKMIEPMVRANVRFNAVEPMNALEDLLTRLAPKWADIRGGIGMTDAQTKELAAAEKAFASAPAGVAKSDALAATLKGLSGQQQSQALMGIAAAMPENLPVNTQPAATPKPSKPAPTKAVPAAKPKPDGK